MPTSIALAKAAHANIGLLLVAREVLERAQPGAHFADLDRSFVGEDALVAVRLDELADPQPARVAPRAHGRQRMVRADYLVAIGDVGAMAEEERAVVRHALQEPVGVA